MSSALDTTGLKTLRRQLLELSAKKIEVGLLANTAGRAAKPGRIDHNPSLGAVHEFGLAYTVLSNKATITLPERSFLRMPLQQKLGPDIEDNLQGRWTTLLRKVGAARFLGVIGAMAENVIQGAFATGGWGAWPKLSPRTIKRKHSARILIETAQMRKAISSRVV